MSDDRPKTLEYATPARRRRIWTPLAWGATSAVALIVAAWLVLAFRARQAEEAAIQAQQVMLRSRQTATKAHRPTATTAATQPASR